MVSIWSLQYCWISGRVGHSYTSLPSRKMGTWICLAVKLEMVLVFQVTSGSKMVRLPSGFKLSSTVSS